MPVLLLFSFGSEAKNRSSSIGAPWGIMYATSGWAPTSRVALGGNRHVARTHARFSRSPLPRWTKIFSNTSRTVTSIWTIALKSALQLNTSRLPPDPYPSYANNFSMHGAFVAPLPTYIYIYRRLRKSRFFHYSSFEIIDKYNLETWSRYAAGKISILL